MSKGVKRTREGATDTDLDVFDVIGGDRKDSNAAARHSKLAAEIDGLKKSPDAADGGGDGEPAATKRLRTSLQTAADEAARDRKDAELRLQIIRDRKAAADAEAEIKRLMTALHRPSNKVGSVLGDDNKSIDLSKPAEVVITELKQMWPNEFRPPSPNSFMPLTANHFEMVEDRDATAMLFLESCFTDLTGRPPSALTQASTQSASAQWASAQDVSTAAGSGGSGSGSGGGGGGAPFDAQRRRLLATHAAPGGGKSRFLDVACELCGTARTLIAREVWTQFCLKHATDSQLPAFKQTMEKRIPITITFNDYQNSEGKIPLEPERAIAARIIHR